MLLLSAFIVSALSQDVTDAPTQEPTEMPTELVCADPVKLGKAEMCMAMNKKIDCGNGNMAMFLYMPSKVANNSATVCEGDFIATTCMNMEGMPCSAWEEKMQATDDMPFDKEVDFDGCTEYEYSDGGVTVTQGYEW